MSRPPIATAVMLVSVMLAPLPACDNGAEEVETPREPSPAAGAVETRRVDVPASDGGDDADSLDSQRPPVPPFGRERQEIGKGGRELSLRTLAHSAEGGFHRFVFEIGRGPYGEDAQGVPRARARYLPDAGAVEVHLPDVRWDLTERFPFLADDDDPVGEPTQVEDGPVRAFARAPSPSERGLLYRVRVERPLQFRLHGMSSPARVVLDLDTAAAAAEAP